MVSNNASRIEPISNREKAIIVGCIATLSTIGNTLVLFAMYRFRNLRTIPNTIIMNLSITDLLFSLIVSPINISIWVKGEETIPSIFCTVAGFAGATLSLVSIYTLVFISVEKFLATNYPLRHRTIFTKKL